MAARLRRRDALAFIPADRYIESGDIPYPPWEEDSKLRYTDLGAMRKAGEVGFERGEGRSLRYRRLPE